MVARIVTERRARRRHRHTLFIGRTKVIRSRSLGRLLAVLRELIAQLRAKGTPVVRVERHYR